MTAVPLVINVRIPLKQGDCLPLEFMAWFFIGFVGCFFFFPTSLLQLWLSGLVIIAQEYSTPSN